MAQHDEPKKLWGGRFNYALDPIMEQFNASISFDKRMWSADITGSLAYAKALVKANIITAEECQSIESGFDVIRQEWEGNKFQLKPDDEDIHTANERRLKELIGKTAGKLHTGRSRNDQVATDMRIWLRDAVKEINQYLLELIVTLVDRADKEMDVLMPGYTHLQRAQPVAWSHWIMSYAWMFQQDCERIRSSTVRLNVCPLGSGALAGNPFDIDRHFLAGELNFTGITDNSMHAVGDRDFIAEFHFWSTLLGVHLSKLAEDLLLFSSKEFSFVTISDAFSTGSSLMPQKKNADGMELIRGKAGRLIGNAISLLVILKGTPSTFNKDLQEDKEGMFDTFETIKGVLRIATGTMKTLTVNSSRCLEALSPDMLATDVAYYLVRKGVPFRDAHELSGRVVSLSETMKCNLSEIPLNDLQKISDNFGEDIALVWNYENSIDQYQCPGGTSKASVRQQIENIRRWLMQQ